MNPQNFLMNGKVVVDPAIYDVLKVKTAIPDAFAVIQDSNELTAIIQAGSYAPANVLASEPGWKLLTFDMVLPFELVGFLALVASVLAEAEVSIFALSAYSTDHILVKTEQLDRATTRLAGLGCAIIRR